MSKPLKHKLALVTGSSRGIGAAVAIRLAAEGASVIVNYSASPARAEKVVKEIRDASGSAEAVGADLYTGSFVNSAAKDTFDSIENLTGTNYNDVLKGDFGFKGYVMSDEAIVKENVPTAIPLVYEFDDSMKVRGRRYLGDASLAEDVFQNTFLQVFVKSGQYEAGRPVRPWLYTIATNQAIDALTEHDDLLVHGQLPIADQELFTARCLSWQSKQ